MIWLFSSCKFWNQDFWRNCANYYKKVLRYVVIWIQSLTYFKWNLCCKTYDCARESRFQHYLFAVIRTRFQWEELTFGRAWTGKPQCRTSEPTRPSYDRGWQITALPVCCDKNQVPMRGASVWPGLDRKAAVPNIRADTAFLRPWMAKSSSTRSVITRFSSLQVPSVNTRLLKLYTQWFIHSYRSFYLNLYQYVKESLVSRHKCNDFNVINLKNFKHWKCVTQFDK